MIDYEKLTQDIKAWGRALGFQQIGITDTDLSGVTGDLKKWLELKFHGSMDYMQKHEDLRTDPTKLIPGTTRIIMARIDYLPPNADIPKVLNNPNKGAISIYAQGKDYHKIIRKKLKKLAEMIKAEVGDFEYRPFADSAPVMEKPLAQKAGLGWIGKHTVLINKKAGSWFFLGALFTNLPLPVDEPATTHCGSCSACMSVCPTKAIVAPFQLDARRCISYLTIENKGPIPIEFRKAIGNRIFGCDDCQLTCPWNKFSKVSTEPGFTPRHNLNNSDLVDLFNWTEKEFQEKTQGSAIKRTGYNGWLRNIAVALGNAPKSEMIIQALKAKLNFPEKIVQEHVTWALKEQENRII